MDSIEVSEILHLSVPVFFIKISLWSKYLLGLDIHIAMSVSYIKERWQNYPKLYLKCSTNFRNPCPSFAKNDRYPNLYLFPKEQHLHLSLIISLLWQLILYLKLKVLNLWQFFLPPSRVLNYLNGPWDLCT